MIKEIALRKLASAAPMTNPLPTSNPLMNIAKKGLGAIKGGIIPTAAAAIGGVVTSALNKKMNGAAPAQPQQAQPQQAQPQQAQPQQAQPQQAQTAPTPQTQPVQKTASVYSRLVKEAKLNGLQRVLGAGSKAMKSIGRYTGNFLSKPLLNTGHKLSYNNIKSPSLRNVADNIGQAMGKAGFWLSDPKNARKLGMITTGASLAGITAGGLGIKKLMEPKEEQVII